MFRTVPLYIISSFSLYTQQWYMSYRFADSLQLNAPISEIYFWDKTVHVSDTSSVHHQQFCTVHTAIHTGLLTACEQDQDGVPS